jgi:hypothetical protein
LEPNNKQITKVKATGKLNQEIEKLLEEKQGALP